MATVLGLLLNPRNLLIAALSFTLAVTWLAYDRQKHAALQCAGSLALCEANVRGCQAEISSAAGIIEVLKRNLDAVRKQAVEWQRIADGAQELRARILAMQANPKECEVLQDGYRKVAGDITVLFNTGGVRGKIRRPDPAGDRAAPGVLPGPGAAGPGGPADDARPAR